MSSAQRVAGRGILLTPEGRVLLVRMSLPWLGELWMVPGGGQEPGETIEDTTRREVHEETGLRDPELGPYLYWRTLRIDTGSEQVDLHEHYFLVRTEEFEPTAPGLTEEERDWWVGHRWFDADEIRASRDRFAPPEIAELVAELVREGPKPMRRISSRSHRDPDSDAS